MVIQNFDLEKEEMTTVWEYLWAEKCRRFAPWAAIEVTYANVAHSLLFSIMAGMCARECLSESMSISVITVISTIDWFDSLADSQLDNTSLPLTALSVHSKASPLFCRAGWEAMHLSSLVVFVQRLSPGEQSSRWCTLSQSCDLFVASITVSVSGRRRGSLSGVHCATFSVRTDYIFSSDNWKDWCKQERNRHVITNRPGRMRNVTTEKRLVECDRYRLWLLSLSTFPLIYLIYHYPSDCHSLMMPLSANVLSLSLSPTHFHSTWSPVWPLTMTFVCHFLFYILLTIFSMFDLY